MKRVRGTGQKYYRRKRPIKNIKLFDILLTLFIFSGLIAAIFALDSSSDSTDSLVGTPRIIDGDTLVIRNRHVRLLGIDAAELNQTCHRNGKPYDCGREAKKALQNEIGNTVIRCEIDGADRYKRDLGRCFKSEKDINAWLVENGWALSYGDYRNEEIIARRAKRGLWSGEFERPSQWRAQNKANRQPDFDSTKSFSAAISKWVYYIKTHILELISR